jgi:hypothetical protein
MIKFKTGLALATLGFAAMAIGNAPANAATMTLEPLQSIASQAAKTDSKAENVSHRHRRNWRAICAKRWGRYNHRYRACLRRHNVGIRRHHGRKWRVICGKRWGYNNPRYRFCVRRNSRR